jgi:uncharacterized protein
MAGHVIERRVLGVAAQRLHETAVLALQGARSVGKSTVLRAIADAREVPVIDLDDTAMVDLVSASPTDFVSGTEPVCVDEYQRVPGILQAIKGELNRIHTPGRYVLTGSTRFDTLPSATQALTGRIQFLDIFPFTQGEIDGTREDFLEVAFGEPEMIARPPATSTDRAEYARRICRGGMPVAIGLSDAGRRRWFDSYVQQTLSNDVPEFAGVRRVDALGRLFERFASQTGQILNVSAAAAATDIEARTADSYAELLTNVFLISRLPAWGRTLRARVGRKPKLHLVDSGLAAHLLRLTPQRLAQLDPASASEFAHLMETFVVGELTRQASWNDDARDIGHWHTHNGHEVDAIVEAYDGRVVGFEVKARSTPVDNDLRGLRELRDLLGGQFRAGFVLTTGRHAGRLDDRLFTCPIDRLWQSHR